MSTTSPEWHGVPLDRTEAWTKIFQETKEVMDLVAPCPVCGVAALHRWYYLSRREERVTNAERFVGRGSLWEWCSNCRSYEHYSALVPAWWSSDLQVDLAKLTAEPEAIEEARIAKAQQNRGQSS